MTLAGRVKHEEGEAAGDQKGRGDGRERLTQPEPSKKKGHVQKETLSVSFCVCVSRVNVCETQTDIFVCWSLFLCVCCLLCELQAGWV